MRLLTCISVSVLAFGILGLLPPRAEAQTVSGTLVDLFTNRPIPLGLVKMFTESGDSVTATITDEVGDFVISSPIPGSFVLRGPSLWGIANRLRGSSSSVRGVC